MSNHGKGSRLSLIFPADRGMDPLAIEKYGFALPSTQTKYILTLVGSEYSLRFSPTLSQFTVIFRLVSLRSFRGAYLVSGNDLELKVISLKT
jgi:hypothetical protein